MYESLSAALKSEEDVKQAESLAFGIYAVSWNVALKVSKSSDNADPDAVFQLRQAAIALLLLGNKPLSIVADRLVLTAEIYQQVW